MRFATTCPNCSNTNLYVSEDVPSSSIGGPNYLPGEVGGLKGSHWAYFRIVVCVDCGLAQFFADDVATGKIPNSRSWYKL